MDSGVQMPEQINDSRDAWHHYRIRLIVFDQKINPGLCRDCPFYTLAPDWSHAPEYLFC